MARSPHTLTVNLPVTGKPEVFDWLGRKVFVSPRTVELTYWLDRDGAVSADVTGPARPAPGINAFHAEMTVGFDPERPEHWPDWLRDLARAHTPHGLT